MAVVHVDPLFQAKEKRDGTGILILPNDCLNRPNHVFGIARPTHFAVMLRVGNRDFVVNNTHNGAVLTADRRCELKLELASRVARLIGSAQKQATAIPRLTLLQRTAPTGACHATYEPGVIVVAQGRKEVQIGTDILTYDSSRSAHRDQSGGGKRGKTLPRDLPQA
jgi:hypothetical protein